MTKAEIEETIQRAQDALFEIYCISIDLERNGTSQDKILEFQQVTGYHHCFTWEVFAQLDPEKQYYVGNKKGISILDDQTSQLGQFYLRVTQIQYLMSWC